MPQATFVPRRDSSLTHVTTFYSYKGGVGRSLLLANVGWLLAAGRKVLLWDLDVEAPGLHRIPALRPGRVERGFFEWMTDCQAEQDLARTGAISPADADALRRLVLPVPKRPKLAILPAHGDGADFAQLYDKAKLRELLFQDPGLALFFFDALLVALGEDCDHLLIDSRTGVTDVGGLLGAMLPHTTVLVGGYGHQSLEGLRRVKTAFEAAGKDQVRSRLGVGEKLNFVQVASPVPPETDSTLAAERRFVWNDVMGAVKPIEIPFDSRLLWSEDLLADVDPECPTAAAYGQVAERLANLRTQLLAEASAASVDELRDPMPRQPFDDPISRQRKGWAFEQRVRRLLELHGYQVEPEQLIGSNRVDLVAKKTGGLDEECWWVECKDHAKTVGKDVAEKLVAWINGKEGLAQEARGMVVARAFTREAIAFARDQAKLKLWTVDELERRLFDPNPYLHGIVAAFERSPLAETYVRQRVLLESRPTENGVDLLEHAVAWADGEGPRLWLLLGDYGTGKSVFFQRLAYELAQRALADPEAPFPLAVDLKEFPNATSVETLFYEHLRKKMPSFRGDPSSLLHLLATGRCVLLLDSFDEMGVAAAGRGVEEQFRELARLAAEEPLETRRGNRVLVTCRTHFFRDQQQVKATAEGRLAGVTATEDSALGKLARRFNAEIDELLLFDEDQIRTFLENQLGEVDARRALEFIEKTYDLPTLAPRPVLLELITKSLPTLWAEGETKVTPAGLYEIYTRQWLEDRSGRSLQTRPEQRHRLLTLLAASLWRREDRQIHHRDLLAEVESLSEHFPGLDFDRVDVELRTAAFLVRSPDGFYRFSHKSFLEYFLARGLWDALDSGSAECLDLPPLSREVGRFLWQIDEPTWEKRREALRRILQTTYRSRVSENALRLATWSVSVTGKRFVIEGAQLAGSRLSGDALTGHVIVEGRDVCVELPSANFSGSMLKGASFLNGKFEGANFDDACLDLARAFGGNFSGASFKRASLVRAKIESALMRSAVMTEAILRDSVLDDTDFSSASMGSVDLSFASGDRTSFEGTDLRRAKLSSSVWTKARFRGSRIEDAEWAGCTVVSGDGLPDIKGWSLNDKVVRVGFHSPDTIGWSRLAFSPDGSTLATAAEGGEVRLLDTQTGEPRRVIWVLQNVLGISWSADSQTLWVCVSSGTVQYWDVGSGEMSREVTVTEEPIFCAAWSNTGQTLAVATTNRSIRVSEEGRPDAAWEFPHQASDPLSLAWSSRQELIASGGSDGGVRIWNFRTKRFVREIETKADVPVWSLAWSRDDRTLATGSADGTIRLWDVESWRLSRELPSQGGRVWSLVWSKDGTTLTSGMESAPVSRWRVAERPQLEDLGFSGEHFCSVAVSSDGEIAAACSVNGDLRVWWASTGERLWERSVTSPGSFAITVADDGRSLRVLAGTESELRWWAAARREAPVDNLGPGLRWESVSRPTDGSWIGSSRVVAFRVVEVETGRLVAELEPRGQALLYTVPGCWFLLSPVLWQTGYRRLRLYVQDFASDTAESWRVLPMAGLACWLERPEKVKAALAGETVEPFDWALLDAEP